MHRIAVNSVLGRMRKAIRERERILAVAENTLQPVATGDDDELRDLSAPAIAEDVDMTLDAAAEGNVVISNISGSITVSGWSRSQVEVTGTLGRNVEKLIFERDGDEITIKVKVPGSGGRGFDSDLDITTESAGADKGGRLDVETVNGSVDIEFSGDVSARFDIDVFNGEIRSCFGPEAERTSKYLPGWQLEFTMGSGDGRVDISTVNGDVSICSD